MTRQIESIRDVAGDYDVVVLDQWGVLHNGSTPYPGTVSALRQLRADGQRLAVLSNSGKRAHPNAQRIAAMGFAALLFETVMTSGEALWHDMSARRVPERSFCPITRAPGEAQTWAQGLSIRLCDDPRHADAVLLMGLPDEETEDEWRETMGHALAADLPVYCSNPDLASPRAGGRTVLSPGSVAHDHQQAGGRVVFYGKPHRAIFSALERALGTPRILMVGDSIDHDIIGANQAGWDSLLVQGGLHAADFHGQTARPALHQLCGNRENATPDFMIKGLI